MERSQFVFIEYNSEELEATPDYDPPFRLGDVLARLTKRKMLGPEEIIVVRLADDFIDSVWPEEVDLLV